MPIDRRTLYPPTDRPLLEGGPFEAGFIALHPFFVVDGLNPALADYGTIVIQRDSHRDESVAELIEEAEVSRHEGNVATDEVEFLAKTRGRPIRWSEVAAVTGIPNFSALNRALLTSIGALKPEFQDSKSAELLRSYCRANRVFMPTEGAIQPMMERGIAALLKTAGLDRAELASEFDATGVDVNVSELEVDAPWEIAGNPRSISRIYAPDRSLLVAVDWDSFFTLIAGTHERLRRSEVESAFEGFPCSSETRHDWWHQNA